MHALEIHPDSQRSIEDQDELVLLALNCRQESMGEHDLSPRYPSAQDPSALEEMVAVAWVVMNRVIRRKQSVRRVILADQQFSWLNTTDRGRASAIQFIKAGRSYQDSWRTAVSAAVLAYYRISPDLSNGADHYYNPDVANPPWGGRMATVAIWGRHIFKDSHKPIRI